MMNHCRRDGSDQTAEEWQRDEAATGGSRLNCGLLIVMVIKQKLRAMGACLVGACPQKQQCQQHHASTGQEGVQSTRYRGSWIPWMIGITLRP
jgi:hypothetical protein